jgi:hypothetical protein
MKLFIFSFLFAASAYAENPSCGMGHPYNREIRKVPVGHVCRTLQGGTFQLVVRTSEAIEVWKNLDTGLFISDYAPYLRMTFDEAQKFCTSQIAERLQGGLKYISWHLPSIDWRSRNGEYTQLYDLGLGDIIYNENWLGDFFWSGTEFTDEGYAMHYNFYTDNMFNVLKDFKELVICIGR